MDNKNWTIAVTYVKQYTKIVKISKSKFNERSIAINEANNIILNKKPPKDSDTDDIIVESDTGPIIVESEILED